MPWNVPVCGATTVISKDPAEDLKKTSLVEGTTPTAAGSSVGAKGARATTSHGGGGGLGEGGGEGGGDGDGSAGLRLGCGGGDGDGGAGLELGGGGDGEGGEGGDGDDGDDGGEGGALGRFGRFSHVCVAGLYVLCGIHVLRPHSIVFDSRAMGTPFRYSEAATRLSARERWQQPPCIARSFDSAASAHLRFGWGPTLCVAASPAGCGVPVFAIRSRSSLGSSTRPSDWRATDCMTAAAAVTSGLADDVPENLPVYASLSPLLP